MEPSLDQEDAPASLGNKVWSQNKDETSALIHTTGQIFNVCLAERKTHFRKTYPENNDVLLQMVRSRSKHYYGNTLKDGRTAEIKYKLTPKFDLTN